MIPAAGRGSRLRTLTQGQPKVLMDLSGKLLLEHLLDRLGEPFTDVCLVSSPPHLGSFRRALGDRYAHLRIHFVVQPEPTGVADAVRQAAGMVRGPFAVVMGDCYYDEALWDSPLRWRDHQTDGAVLVESTDSAGDQQMGLVTLAGERIEKIWKGTWDGETEWRVCGAFLLPESYFAAAEVMPRAKPGECELEDVVALLIASGSRFSAVPYGGWRRNVNTPEDVAAVSERIAAGTIRDPSSASAT